MKPELVLETKCLLGEGPWWDAKPGLLYWIGGLDGMFYVYDPKTGVNREYTMGRMVGCVIPCAQGGVLVNLQDGVFLFDTETEKLTELSDIERNISNNRLNDGGCDSTGRFWFGSMSMTANQEGRKFETTGSFYSMDGRGRVKKHFGGVGISNGIAWNADETVMFFIDTMTGRVDAFDFDVQHGSIKNRRVVVRIKPAEGAPDGMTIDEEGMLWVAHFGGGRVARYDPATGAKLSEVLLPADNVTCCGFGGEKLDELYITTARTGLTSRQLEQQPLAGGLFRVRPGVHGMPANKYQLG